MSSAPPFAGWTTKPLIEVATLQRGYDLPVQDRADGLFPIFAANGPVGYHSTAKCKGPGVVTGRSGTIGKVHFVMNDYWPLNTSLYVTDFHGNDPRWVYYMLQNFGLERFSQGAGVPTLNRNLIHGEPVRVPPVWEQRRIAAILDKANGLLAKRREALAQFDRLAHANFVEMFGDPVTNPKGWRRLQLGEIFGIARGGSPRPIDDYITDSADGVNWVMIGDTEQGGKYIWSTRKKIRPEGVKRSRLVSSGDFLLTNSMSFGRPYILKTSGCIHDGWLVLSPQIPDFNPDYFYALLGSQAVFTEFSKRAAGATVKNLNIDLVSSVEVAVPPLVEQRRFAKTVEAIEAVKSRSESSATQLDSLFGSLQSRAFSGEL